ncbi:ribosome biogenesis protein [Parasponia andersonii]|uniref:Ribosome biogenesis protein n=1 Tax=Parasponia andersonii TaxID=3476 RepID=A0A2P5DL31_PARAD|nr:ribosome biogenesis protein [Parasponia andersonii]
MLYRKKKLRSRQKKLKAYDLSSLSEFLPKFKKSQQPPPADWKLNCKSRQKLMSVCNHPFEGLPFPFILLLKLVLSSRIHFTVRLKEAKQLSTVLKHPAFQSDPLPSIHQHLQSTQPVIDEKPKKKNKNGGTKKKDKKTKASTGPESMDM